jgi:hypothetical protein
MTNFSQFETDLLSKIQADRCKKLLWAVISLAVEDACRDPYKTRPEAESITAMRFLIGDGNQSDSDSYFLWLDVDSREFRKRLIEAMFADRHDKFSDAARRAFRANYNWWRRNALQVSRDFCEKDRN